MEYPIHITNEGKTVKPLVKKTYTHSTSSSSSSGDFTATKAQVDGATEKALHSGFVVGAKVEIKSGYTATKPTGEVVGYKDTKDGVYFRYQSMRLIDDVCVIRVRVVPATGNPYYSCYAISELELL